MSRAGRLGVAAGVGWGMGSGGTEHSSRFRRPAAPLPMLPASNQSSERGRASQAWQNWQALASPPPPPSRAWLWLPLVSLLGRSWDREFRPRSPSTNRDFAGQDAWANTRISHAAGLEIASREFRNAPERCMKAGEGCKIRDQRLESSVPSGAGRSSRAHSKAHLRASAVRTPSP